MADLRRSLAINFFTASGATLMQFVVSILLARMLSPSEIGVFSMTIVFVNIAHIFRDFGVGGYLQREAELTPEKIRSAIGVLFTSSWLIALLLFMMSGWFGEWLQEPRVVPIMRVLSLGFLVIPFGSITNSLLVRELAAEKQAVVGAAGTISSCVSCVTLAVLGFGTMSIAWANLISVSVSAIGQHAIPAEGHAMAAFVPPLARHRPFRCRSARIELRRGRQQRDSRLACLANWEAPTRSACSAARNSTV